MIQQSTDRRTLFKMCLIAKGQSLKEFAEQIDVHVNQLHLVLRGLADEKVEPAVDAFIRDTLPELKHHVTSAESQFGAAA